MKLTIITATIIEKVRFLSPIRGKCQRKESVEPTKGVIKKVRFLSPTRGNVSIWIVEDDKGGNQTFRFLSPIRGKCQCMDGGGMTKGVKILHRSCYIEVDVKF